MSRVAIAVAIVNTSIAVVSAIIMYTIHLVEVREMHAADSHTSNIFYSLTFTASSPTSLAMPLSLPPLQSQSALATVEAQTATEVTKV